MYCQTLAMIYNKPELSSFQNDREIWDERKRQNKKIDFEKNAKYFLQVCFMAVDLVIVFSYHLK